MIADADLTTPTWTGPGPSGGTPWGVSPLGEGLVTAVVVAAHLGIDVSCVYRMAGKSLPVVLIGRAKRFRVADVRAFIERQTRGGDEQARPVDRVQQLLAGAARTSRGCGRRRSNDLDASRRQSVHRAPKQEPWRAPGLRPNPTPEDN